MQTADAIFEAELTRRGVSFCPPDSEGLYRVQTDHGEITVNLENIRRGFQRDHDRESVVRFVDQVLGTFVLPTWDNATRPADANCSDGVQYAKRSCCTCFHYRESG